MSRQSPTEVKAPSGKTVKATLTDTQIAKYLKAHPDFFQRNTEWAWQLTIPHDSGSAVSLIEYQVSQLRQQQKKLQQRIEELVHIARENDEISDRVHQLTLRIIESRGFEHVVHAVESSLMHEFHLQAVTMRIVGYFQGEDSLDDFLRSLFIPRMDAGPELIGLMQYQEPVCGKLNAEQMQYLFGLDKPVHSAALLPLGFGVIGLGSEDAQRFHAGMATHFLKHLAEIIARKLSKYVRMYV